MARRLSRSLTVSVFVICCFSSSLAQQTMLSDVDKGEIVRAVIRKDLERTLPIRKLFGPRTILSSYGIESLRPEAITSDLEINVLSPEEIAMKLHVGSIFEYLMIEDIFPQATGIVVGVSDVKEQQHKCFGPTKRCKRRLIYQVHRVGAEWIAELVTRPIVNFDFIKEQCDEMDRELIF